MQHPTLQPVKVFSRLKLNRGGTHVYGPRRSEFNAWNAGLLHSRPNNEQRPFDLPRNLISR